MGVISRRITLRFIAAALLLVLAAEAAIHISRINDFPIYDVNNRIGYIPKPDQAGAFLWRNDWVFNELSMGTERPFRPGRGLLLVGDSVVNGGNPLRHSERLGPALERRTGVTVWPISAGSWGLQNEVTWLNDNPEVVAGVGRIALVLNSRDFDKPSSFRTDYTHPRERPFPALPYILKRYAVGFTPEATPADLEVRKTDALALLAEFASRHPVDVFLHPDQTELDRGCQWTPSQIRLIPGVTLHCIDTEAGWDRSNYYDEIHPTASGVQNLAAIIAAELKSNP
jgi:hypothetical protein